MADGVVVARASASGDRFGRFVCLSAAPPVVVLRRRRRRRPGRPEIAVRQSLSLSPRRSSFLPTFKAFFFPPLPSAHGPDSATSTASASAIRLGIHSISQCPKSLTNKLIKKRKDEEVPRRGYNILGQNTHEKPIGS